MTLREKQVKMSTATSRKPRNRITTPLIKLSRLTAEYKMLQTIEIGHFQSIFLASRFALVLAFRARALVSRCPANPPEGYFRRLKIFLTHNLRVSPFTVKIKLHYFFLKRKILPFENPVSAWCLQIRNEYIGSLKTSETISDSAECYAGL